MSIHLAIALWTVFAAWRWGRWIQFSQCYPTMVYLACFQLLYEFFSHEKFYLWRLEPDPVFNYTSVVMLHTFCIYPLTAFLYLTRFPEVEDDIPAIQHPARIILYPPRPDVWTMTDMCLLHLREFPYRIFDVTNTPTGGSEVEDGWDVT